MINLMFPSADTQVSDQLFFLSILEHSALFICPPKGWHFIHTTWEDFYCINEVLVSQLDKETKKSFFSLFTDSAKPPTLPFGLRTSGILGWAAGRCLAPALPSSKAPVQSYFRENSFSSKAELLWMGSLRLSGQNKEATLSCPHAGRAATERWSPGSQPVRWRRECQERKRINILEIIPDRLWNALLLPW